MKESKQFNTSLIDRILAKLNLSDDVLPTDIHTWQTFINKMKNLNRDFEQERYLIERSLEISSREMLEINKKLEDAQNIAHIGYWNFDPVTDYVYWSKEVYRQFGYDPNLAAPRFDEILKKLHPDDSARLVKLVDKAIQQNQKYELKIRVMNANDNKTTWLQVRGIPYEKKQNDQIIYGLSGVCVDITEQVEAEKSLAELNAKLLEVSRQAGMSEIATFVLHNIGNVLNSVNTSILLLDEYIQESEMPNLGKACQLFDEKVERHKELNNPDYKLDILSKYMSTLHESLMNEQIRMSKEVSSIAKNIVYIKDIVAKQKDISGVSGVKEQILLSELCDSAIELSFSDHEIKHINIRKDYNNKINLNTDRSRLLQILINLLTNAKHAVIMKADLIKTVALSINQVDDANVDISVEDDGIGIDEKDINKIFSMGYTTKEQGHGFGLHSSAIAANELNGQLSIYSPGQGKGAKFTLRLPLDETQSSSEVKYAN